MAVGGAAAARAVRELAGWAAGFSWDRLPCADADRMATALFDVLAAASVGAAAPEQRAVRAAWSYPPGNAPVVGGGRLTDAATAALLNGQATVCRELDEGNKYTRGHPAAHGFPAVLALAAETDVSGRRTWEALVVAYEVAARFGRATVLHRGAHPHGNWGVTGAAAGCAHVLGLDADGIAAAIDAGAGMPIAGHFGSALDGNPVRDLWVGSANAAGISAARLAAAGVARNTGTPALSLGDLLGSFDPDELTDSLGERFEVRHNYFKRHAACSFTHPVADLLLRVRADLLRGDHRAESIVKTVREIRVRTHALAAGLGRVGWRTPLGAMFSVPFVAAAALLEGEVSPPVVARAPQDAPLLSELARRVSLVEDPELTARLPACRAATVTVVLADGTELHDTADNPVGDSDFHPFDRDDLSAVFARWLGRSAVACLHRVVDGLAEAPGARAPLSTLTEPAEAACASTR